MKKLLQFEFQKLRRQKILRIFLTISVLQVLSAIFIFYNPRFLSISKGIHHSFLIPYYIGVNVLFLSCKIFSEDFQYRTLMHISLRYPNKFTIFMAKWINIVLIHLLLQITCSLLTLTIATCMFGYRLDTGLISQVLIYNSSIMLPSQVLVLLSAIMIVYTRKESPGIVTSLFIYVCYVFGTGVNFLIITEFELFKFGIVNLFNLPNQLITPQYIELTHIGITGMVISLCIYIFVELMILSYLTRSIQN